jgi:hypothetical protein
MKLESLLSTEINIRSDEDEKYFVISHTFLDLDTPKHGKDISPIFRVIDETQCLS